MKIFDIHIVLGKGHAEFRSAFREVIHIHNFVIVLYLYLRAPCD
jgi:hypothetical protein